MVGIVIYEEPSSIYIKSYYGATLLALAYLAISEVVGKHLQYSKFCNTTKSNNNNNKQILLSSKIGMLLLYTPALLAGISSFGVFPNGGISGFMVLDSAILISATYFTSAVSMIYFQQLSEGFPEPSIDLKYVGVSVFLVGIFGNFYHHYLLLKLREEKSDKGYKIPRGGLFSLVICPHYLFEILTFIGISLISQTFFSYLCAIGVAFYLLGRSYATRNWYLSKFENFPKNVKALIPYVF
ncbi:hypothetical protein BUALT_Bualt01G0123500 [Buddleja alternifolia]|uniref:3-oxo-5-alpha-steroid 4-dehydrogenase C-terminal domain-containing protein n=1 Tax=Buddleja alternifolia TaxID=168488 RepID=A0AAV6YCG8_9LAMI|nr:hypothetical protein BUALT_Bualt01G0123500 [Buddleja alternifolia]